MQPKQQLALDLMLAGHTTTEVAAQIGVRRETVWRYTQDPDFAAEVSRRRAERRLAVHAELDAGVREAVQMLRGLVSDPEAPHGARVRAATALMDRAGLTPAYAVEVRHKDDQRVLEAEQQEMQDPAQVAREILQAMPIAVRLLPPDEVREALNRVEAFL